MAKTSRKGPSVSCKSHPATSCTKSHTTASRDLSQTKSPSNDSVTVDIRNIVPSSREDAVELIDSREPQKVVQNGSRHPLIQDMEDHSGRGEMTAGNTSDEDSDVPPLV